MTWQSQSATRSVLRQKTHWIRSFHGISSGSSVPELWCACGGPATSRRVPGCRWMRSRDILPECTRSMRLPIADRYSPRNRRPYCGGCRCSPSRSGYRSMCRQAAASAVVVRGSTAVPAARRRRVVRRRTEGDFGGADRRRTCPASALRLVNRIAGQLFAWSDLERCVEAFGAGASRSGVPPAEPGKDPTGFGAHGVGRCRLHVSWRIDQPSEYAFGRFAEANAPSLLP